MFYTWSIRPSKRSEYQMDVISRISMYVTSTLIYKALLQALASSESKHQNIQSTCGSVVIQYSKLLMFCGFTYLGLLTGNDVTSATTKLSKGDSSKLFPFFWFLGIVVLCLLHC